MKVVLAFDKFKGSVTSQQLNEAVQDDLCGLDDVTTVCVPVADGGDGTTAVLAAKSEGQWVTVPTMGPLLQQAPVNASYFLTDDATALIEVAAASPLAAATSMRAVASSRWLPPVDWRCCRPMAVT